MKEQQRDLRLYMPVYAIFFAIYVFAGFVEPNFFTWRNNVNLFTRITPLVLVGMAQTFVLLSGGIDLSIGGIIGLSSVIAASLPFVDTPLNVIMWICIPPLLGLSLGLINGVIIARGGFNPLVVTLATGAIWTGVTLFVMPIPGGSVSLSVAKTVAGAIFKVVPTPLVIFLAFVFFCHFVLRRTEFGRSIYAIGGDESIAYESGIPCTRVKILVYGMSGLLAAFAGMFLSAWMFCGDPLIGDPYILNSIAVAVIAGTALEGGRGGVVGIIGGAYILHLISNILNLLAVSPFYQFIARGLVLILALSLTSSGATFNIRGMLDKLLLLGRRTTGAFGYKNGQ
jgi:ribose transport system permease protein